MHIPRVFQNLCFFPPIFPKIRPFLSLSDAERLVHAFGTSRVDYCKAFILVYLKNTYPLQYIQNSAAHVLILLISTYLVCLAVPPGFHEFCVLFAIKMTDFVVITSINLTKLEKKKFLLNDITFTKLTLIKN